MTPPKKNKKADIKSDTNKGKSSTKKSGDEFEILSKFLLDAKDKNEKDAKRDKVKIGYNYSTIGGPPYVTAYIEDHQVNKLLNIYADAVCAGKKVSIAEKHKEIGPIVIDLDFVQSKKDSQRSYTTKTIKKCILIYNKIIKTYLDVDDGDMIAYVTEKDEPTFRKGAYHDGIHIMYPEICTKPALQMKMRQDFIKKLTEKNMFVHMPLINPKDPDNTGDLENPKNLKKLIENIVDEAVIYRNCWCLYGSCKSDSASKPYELTHVYETVSDGPNTIHITDVFDDEFADKIIDGKFNDKTLEFLIKKLSIRKFTDENDLTPLAEGIDPEMLNDEVSKLTSKMVEKLGAEKTEEYIGTDIRFTKVATSEEELIEAKNLVTLFSEERAFDYHKWYQVGLCLHNIDHRLLEDWIEFSKKSPAKFKKNKKGELERLWRRMKPSNYGMPTLHYFASRDNKKEYIKLQNKRQNTLTKKCIDIPEHHTIAQLLMSTYQYRFKCASVKHDIWYEFKNHRWVKIDSAYTLRNLISEDLTKIFEENRRALRAKASEKSGTAADDIDKKAAYVGKIIKSLNNNSFKNGVIKECAYLAYDPVFLKNLDENINLICFENGVFDLNKDAYYFRDGCPDDYISLCVNYKYIEYDPSDQDIKDIHDFLDKIQTDPEMKEYLLTLLSTCLAGSIKEESFYVLTGGGGNGKTKLMELLKLALGDYYKPMDVRLLTEKRGNSSSASPEVADKKGIRACTFDEPNANDEINTGFMKLFTGGDEITARALFQEPIYFKPQFKPFLLCNKLPAIRADDDGTWRRLKAIPFESKFIVPSKLTRRQREKPEENPLPAKTFVADLSINEKFSEWRQAFMSMLITAYAGYLKNGLIHPKTVTRYTTEYQKTCDVYSDFITDTLEQTKSSKDAISVMNLHDLMKKWYKSNYDGKCPNAKELRNYLEKRTEFYTKKNDLFVSHKIKSLDNTAVNDELDDMDASVE